MMHIPILKPIIIPQPLVSTTNLKWVYPFTELSGTIAYDAHDDDNNGTISGATLNQSGPTNLKAFGFSNDYVSTPVTLNVTNFSLAIWICPTTTGGINCIFRGGYRALYLYNGKVTVYDAAWLSVKFSISVNVWTHVMWTWDSSNNVKLYKNGVLASSGSRSSSRYPGAPKIGNDSWGQDFNGYMAQPIAWNDTRELSDASNLYNNGDGLTYENWL